MKRADTGAVYFQSIQWGQDVLDMVNYQPPPRTFGELIEEAEKTGKTLSPSQVAAAERGYPTPTPTPQETRAGDRCLWEDLIAAGGGTTIYDPNPGSLWNEILEAGGSAVISGGTVTPVELDPPSTRPPSKRR